MYESSTKFQRKFFVAKGCGNDNCHKPKMPKTHGFNEILGVATGIATTFCHKKNSLEFRGDFVTCLTNSYPCNEIFNEISTKKMPHKICGKTNCHNHCHNLCHELVLFKEFFCRLIVTQNLRSRDILLTLLRKKLLIKIVRRFACLSVHAVRYELRGHVTCAFFVTASS